MINSIYLFIYLYGNNDRDDWRPCTFQHHGRDRECGGGNLHGKFIFILHTIDYGSGHEFGFGVNSGEGHAESVNYEIVEFSIKHDIWSCVRWFVSSWMEERVCERQKSRFTATSCREHVTFDKTTIGLYGLY